MLGLSIIGSLNTALLEFSEVAFITLFTVLSVRHSSLSADVIYIYIYFFFYFRININITKLLFLFLYTIKAKLNGTVLIIISVIIIIFGCSPEYEGVISKRLPTAGAAGAVRRMLGVVVDELPTSEKEEIMKDAAEVVLALTTESINNNNDEDVEGTSYFFMLIGALLIVTSCILSSAQAKYASQLAGEIGGSKRVHAISVAVAVFLFSPVAFLSYVGSWEPTEETELLSFSYIFTISFVALTTIVPHLYLHVIMQQKLDQGVSRNISLFSTFCGAIALDIFSTEGKDIFFCNFPILFLSLSIACNIYY